MQPLRWGVVSTAWIAGLVTPCINASDTSELVAVGSRDLDRGRQFAAEHGIERVHEGYDHLLADEAVEAVYIALPNALHCEWIQRALRAGKHVLCEKPLTLTSLDARACFALAQERGLLLMEAFMYRHHPQIQRAQELIAAGGIGEVQTVYSSFFTHAPDPDANIRFDATLGGGALWDVGSYCVSLSTLFGGGAPVRVCGAVARGPTGVDITSVGLLAFDGGLIAQFACGIATDLRTEATIVGAEKVLTIDNPWLPDVPADIWHGAVPDPGFVVRQGTAAQRTVVSGANPYQLELENFAAAVRGEAQPLIGSDETLTNLRVVEDLRKDIGGLV